MSSFYTSVERYGNNILWRGYENNKRFERKIKFSPTLFVGGDKSGTSQHKSLTTGRPMTSVVMDTMREAKD